MLKNMVAAAALAACALTPGGAFAMPIDSSIASGTRADSPIEPVRLFCYNRYTGAFLHWGGCGRRVYYRPRGRVYCRTRYTHRFLHWGYC